MTGKTFGKRPPKWQWAGNHLGSNRQNGNGREAVWEVTAKTAVPRKPFGRQPPKWQWLENRLGSDRQNPHFDRPNRNFHPNHHESAKNGRRTGAHQNPRRSRHRVHLRLLRRRRDPDLRCAGNGQDEHEVHPRPPRAGSRPHGRRLRPRHRQARRRSRHLRPRRWQYRHRPHDRPDGQRADDRPLRPAGHLDAREGCLPGGGHLQHHGPGREAQLPGEELERAAPHRQGGLSHRHHGPSGPGAHRHSEGHQPRPLHRHL
jgi:hypothetical protein